VVINKSVTAEVRKVEI